jgi:hypothetical protein
MILPSHATRRAAVALIGGPQSIVALPRPVRNTSQSTVTVMCGILSGAGPRQGAPPTRSAIMPMAATVEFDLRAGRRTSGARP